MTATGATLEAVQRSRLSSSRRRFITQLAFLSGLLAAGLAIASTSLRIPILCPLRLATGVPCPLCGMTTGTTALMRGDAVTALRANPLSLLFLPGVLGIVFDRLRRVWLGLDEMVFAPRRRRLIGLISVALVSFSWVFQLYRYSILG